MSALRPIHLQQLCLTITCIARHHVAVCYQVTSDFRQPYELMNLWKFLSWVALFRFYKLKNCEKPCYARSFSSPPLFLALYSFPVTLLFGYIHYIGPCIATKAASLNCAISPSCHSLMWFCLLHLKSCLANPHCTRVLSSRIFFTLIQ